MRPPLVSILTPVYNAGDYIADVLAAISAQTYQHIEHLVVDDGSTDSSLELIEAYGASSSGANVRVLAQQNAGESVAVNRAFRECRGKYVVVVNADDPPMPDLVAATVAILEDSASAVDAYPDWEMIDASGKSIRVIRTLDYNQQALVADYVCIPGPGALIRKDAVKAGFLRDERYTFVSDYELWLRLSLEGEMVRCPRILATWRSHNAGTTAQGRGVLLADEYQRVISDFFRRDDLPAEIRRWEKQARSMVTYHAAIQKVYDSSVPGRRLMLRSLLTPFRRRSSYATYRRRALVVAVVFLSPLCMRFIRRRSG